MPPLPPEVALIGRNQEDRKKPGQRGGRGGGRGESVLQPCFVESWNGPSWESCFIMSNLSLTATTRAMLPCCYLPTGRRNAPPLNLTGLPGTEKLNEKEKEVSGEWSTTAFKVKWFLALQGCNGADSKMILNTAAHCCPYNRLWLPSIVQEHSAKSCKHSLLQLKARPHSYIQWFPSLSLQRQPAWGFTLTHGHG